MLSIHAMAPGKFIARLADWRDHAGGS